MKDAQEKLAASERKENNLAVRLATIETNNTPPQPTNTKKNFSIISTVPIFKGTHAENIEQFFMKISQASIIGSWTDEDKLLVARQQLQGEALDFAVSEDSCKEAKTFADFEKAMLKRYRTKETMRFYREKVATMKMDSKETVEEFGDRITVANAKTYALADNTEANKATKYEADQRALDAFLNGLHVSIAERVRLTGPAKFEEALSRAVAVVESARRAGENTPVKTVFATSAKSCYNCGKANHVSAVCRNPPKCFTCGKIGHLSRMCRHATAAQGQERMQPRQEGPRQGIQQQVHSNAGNGPNVASSGRGFFRGFSRGYRGQFRSRGYRGYRGYRGQMNNFAPSQQYGNNSAQPIHENPNVAASSRAVADPSCPQ